MKQMTAEQRWEQAGGMSQGTDGSAKLQTGGTIEGGIGRRIKSDKDRRWLTQDDGRSARQSVGRAQKIKQMKPEMKAITGARHRQSEVKREIVSTAKMTTRHRWSTENRCGQLE